jgi:hypothetical protein
MSKKNIYRISFINQDKTYEIYARQAGPSDILGFVLVSGLVFGEKSGLVVDPSEDSLRSEFRDVKQTHIPMHAIVRIDEVEKIGVARVSAVGNAGNVTALPFPMPDPEAPSA